jgi:preprotein translocase subunit SecD
MLTLRLAAFAALLSVTATVASAQDSNVLEIARVNPDGGAKTRTVPLETAGQTRMVQIEDPAPITQAQVSHAAVMKGKTKVTSGDRPETKEVSVIRISLNSGGTKALADLTSAWQGKILAVVVDGKVISMPTIPEVIKDGELTISGTFTPDEAKAIVAKIQEALEKK